MFLNTSEIGIVAGEYKVSSVIDQSSQTRVYI